MTTPTKITAADLDWEEPSISRNRGGVCEKHCAQIGEMRSALATRRGQWAVLDTFEKPAQASAAANALAKRRDTSNDSRLAGIEVAGRKMLDGGSKLYVRMTA